MEKLWRVNLLWQRWIDILTAMLSGLLEASRSRRAFTIACDEENYVVRQAGSAGGAVVATLTPGLQAPADFIRLARSRFLTFELPAGEVVRQRVSVPARAREFLAGIVRNQIERLSPWQGDEAAYGFSANANPNESGNLDVQVLVTSRASVEAAREELAEIGLALDRVVAPAPGPEGGPAVVVWSRFDDGSEGGQARIRKTLAWGLIGALGLTAGLTVWAQISAASIRSDSDEMAVRSAAIRRELQEGRGALLGTSRDPAERAWLLKETIPSSVMILDALTRTIPDAAYLTEFSLQNTTVRIVGLASDAPALIAPLEKSGQFADVHFFAPTTRSPDGLSYMFHIEGRVTPSPAARK